MPQFVDFLLTSMHGDHGRRVPASNAAARRSWALAANLGGAALLAACLPGLAGAQAPPGFIQLVTDSARVFVEPALPVPGYLAPSTDSTFGTTVARITGDPGTALGGGSFSGTWSTEARHHFFTDQPWNSDGSLLALQNRGSPSTLFLDGRTYAPRYGRCPDLGDDRWHPGFDHPHERIATQGAELMWYDVTQCVETRTWSLPFAVDGIGSGNGNPSADGRFIALGDTSRVFVVDMDPQPPFAAYPAERIGPAFDLSACGLVGGCKVSWFSITPSGKYVVASYADGHPRVLDVDPVTLALTPHELPATAPRCAGDPAQGFTYDVTQADLARNPFDGDEDVLVGQEHCGNVGGLLDGQLVGDVVMVRLRDGALTPLTDPTKEAYVQSVSARNDRRPGWVYVGYYPQDGKRFSDEIVAVKLDGSRSVERLAYKRSAYQGCYRCVPHPVPSRDGRRVLWASNWAQSCGPCGAPTTIAAYVADASAPDLAPLASIDEPAADDTIFAGDTLSLAGSGGDPDGDLPLAFHWDLGGGGPSFDVEVPGPVAFLLPGIYTVTFTVTDARGVANATAATRRITVLEPAAESAHEVHWTFTGPSSVTFDWRAGSPFIRFGPDSSYGNIVRAVAPQPLPFSSPGPFREARLTGLSPATVYHYAIGSDPDHTFHTPPPAGTSDFDIYVTADVGSSSAYRVIPVLESIIAADLPQFCLLPGDLSYGNAHGQAAVEQHFDDMMAWSRDAAYMPAWGNHEWDEPASDDLRNYKGRFDLPNPQSSPGTPAISDYGKDWYWFDYGNVRFIAYPEPWVGAWDDWAVHARALMDQAQADPTIAFIVTFGHRPAYSSGHHPGSAKLKGILDALGTTHAKYLLDLCGHSHDYERSYPQSGVIHVTNGGGGGGLEDDPSAGCVWLGGCPPPAWTAFRAMHYSVLKLHFGASSIEGWAICGPPAPENDVTCTLGSPMDHFVIQAPNNLVANPSFESSLKGWAAYGGARLTRVAGGFDGGYAAEVDADTTSRWIGINDTPNWVATTLAAGERYRFTAWMRSPAGQGRARLRVREYGGAPKVPPAISEVAIGPDWQQVALDYVTARAHTTLDFQALYSGAGGRVQIDAVSIARIDSAAGASSASALRANPAPPSDDPATWDDDELEDGGGAATLGQRESEYHFAARVYPSPLHERSVLTFSTTRRGPAEVTLYDVHGRVVRALVREADLGPGRHDVAIDGRDDRGQPLEPGIYLYRVHAREGSLTGRCVILK